MLDAGVEKHRVFSKRPSFGEGAKLVDGGLASWYLAVQSTARARTTLRKRSVQRGGRKVEPVSLSPDLLVCSNSRIAKGFSNGLTRASKEPGARSTELLAPCSLLLAPCSLLLAPCSL